MVGFASPLPWPSFAYMEAQSGTLYRHQVKQKIAEYEAHGCTFIGVTRFGPKQQYANVWCVRVEEFPDE